MLGGHFGQPSAVQSDARTEYDNGAAGPTETSRGLAVDDLTQPSQLRLAVGLGNVAACQRAGPRLPGGAPREERSQAPEVGSIVSRTSTSQCNRRVPLHNR